MIFDVFNGFSQVERFRGITRISTLMEKVAGFMSENGLKKCTVHQIRNGDFSGTVYDVWKTDGKFYYKTRASLTGHRIHIESQEVAVC